MIWKLKNTKLENYIANVSEPLNSIAYKLGFEYENYLFEEVWKTAALNAAHDSIGMCNSDETNLDIEQRLNITKSLIENFKWIKKNERNRIITENIINTINFKCIIYCRTIEVS